MIGKRQRKFVSMRLLDWRVDVGISSSSIRRVMLATVVMRMELSDGRVVCFEMPASQFTSQLRFNVALALKDIEDLLNRNVLKIYD